MININISKDSQNKTAVNRFILFRRSIIKAVAVVLLFSALDLAYGEGLTKKQVQDIVATEIDTISQIVTYRDKRFVNFLNKYQELIVDVLHGQLTSLGEVSIPTAVRYIGVLFNHYLYVYSQRNLFNGRHIVRAYLEFIFTALMNHVQDSVTYAAPYVTNAEFEQTYHPDQLGLLEDLLGHQPLLVDHNQPQFPIPLAAHFPQPPLVFHVPVVDQSFQQMQQQALSQMQWQFAVKNKELDDQKDSMARSLNNMSQLLDKLAREREKADEKTKESEERLEQAENEKKQLEEKITGYAKSSEITAQGSTELKETQDKLTEVENDITQLKKERDGAEQELSRLIELVENLSKKLTTDDNEKTKEVERLKRELEKSEQERLAEKQRIKASRKKRKEQSRKLQEENKRLDMRRRGRRGACRGAGYHHECSQG